MQLRNMFFSFLILGTFMMSQAVFASGMAFVPRAKSDPCKTNPDSDKCKTKEKSK